MPEYTYDNWLKGVENIIAYKHLFSLTEWAKVEAKQKEILKEVIEEEYSILLQSYEEDLAISLNKEEFQNSLIQELASALEYGHIQSKVLVPELQELESYFYKNKAGTIGVFYKSEIITPEFPVNKDVRKVAKAHSYIRFYNYLRTLQSKADSDVSRGKDGLTTKQQILLIHYLNKIEALKLNIIHQDQTKQAKVLNYLLDRDSSNVYEGLNQISKEKFKSTYFTLPNLRAILPIFENLDRHEIVTEIKSEIDTAELRSEKN